MVEGNCTKCVFLVSRSLLLNHLEPQSSKTKLLLPIIPIDIVAYAFTLLLDNLCRNSCIKTVLLDTSTLQPFSSSVFLFCFFFYFIRETFFRFIAPRREFLASLSKGLLGNSEYLRDDMASCGLRSATVTAGLLSNRTY